MVFNHLTATKQCGTASKLLEPQDIRLSIVVHCERNLMSDQQVGNVIVHIGVVVYCSTQKLRGKMQL